MLIPSFVSDVGAREMKPLFVIGSWTSATLLNISSFFKHRPLPAPPEFPSEKNKIVQHTSYLSTALTAAGSLGLMMLAYFDRLQHADLHHTFLALYVYVVSITFVHR